VAPGIWMTKKTNPTSAPPSNLAEIARLSTRPEAPEWPEPSSGDLLSDVYFLEQQISRETDDRLRGSHHE
jgi:hypothetical protein